jgi:hypothetical protein
MTTDSDYKVHGTEATHNVIKSTLQSKKKRGGKRASGRKKKRRQAGEAGGGTETESLSQDADRPKEDHEVDYYA